SLLPDERRAPSPTSSHEERGPTCVRREGSLAGLLSLNQLNPNPVRAFDEGLLPAKATPDGSRSHHDLDTFTLQSFHRVLKVLDFEAQMVQFFAVSVSGTKLAALLVPVQF